MAVFLLPMSAVPPITNHMSDASGQSVSPASCSAEGSKRPKLSLRTNSLSTSYESLSRGLASNPAEATYTPTTTNTLANTWDLSVRPSPVFRTESPKPQNVHSQTPTYPYVVSLPFGIKPILKNSPLPPKPPSISASPRDTRKKVFFPQPKVVAFRNTLEDVIVNKEFVAKHYDLSSSEDEGSPDDSPDTNLSPSNTSDHPTCYVSPPPSRKRKKRRDSGVSLRLFEDEQDPSSEHQSLTAPSLRTTKRRRWSWTEDHPQAGDSDEGAIFNEELSTNDTSSSDYQIRPPEVLTPDVPTRHEPCKSTDLEANPSSPEERTQASAARNSGGQHCPLEVPIGEKDDTG